MIYITCIAVCFMLILFCAIITLKCTKCERLSQAHIPSSFFYIYKNSIFVVIECWLLFSFISKT